MATYQKLYQWTITMADYSKTEITDESGEISEPALTELYSPVVDRLRWNGSPEGHKGFN